MVKVIQKYIILVGLGQIHLCIDTSVVRLSLKFKFLSGATVAKWQHSRLPPEAGVRFMALPQVGKLVVACRSSAVYSTEP